MAKKKATDEPSKLATRGRKPVSFLTGTASALVRVEVRISDTKYEVEILTDDVENERVWFEGPADDEGWMKLYYSADGPTGDPFPIGKIRFYLVPDELDGHFGNVAALKMDEAK